MAWNAPTDIANNYIKFVEKCLIDEVSFNSFKSNDTYNSVVGMSNADQARIWYNKIKTEFPSIYENLDMFMENDIHGNPSLINIDNHNISANTLRYLNTLCDIKKAFGNFDNRVVVELGVGYGGLALIFNKYFDLKSYHLLDLRPVQKFAMKYLNKSGIYNIVSYNEPPKRIDLFISEFCLSEFNDQDIEQFYEKYIKKANTIYIMSNLHDSSRKERLINKLSENFDLEIVPEFPVSPWPNYIIFGRVKLKPRNWHEKDKMLCQQILTKNEKDIQ